MRVSRTVLREALGETSRGRLSKQLAVRQWECAHCGESHDRDVNAARNILIAGSRCRTSVRGNESSPAVGPPSQTSRLRKAGSDTQKAAA